MQQQSLNEKKYSLRFITVIFYGEKTNIPSRHITLFQRL